MPISATAVPRGPLIVTGDLSDLILAWQDGTPVDVEGREKLVLCRCGASVRQPFCDGTHTKIGFDGAEAALKTADSLSEQPASPTPGS